MQYRVLKLEAGSVIYEPMRCNEFTDDREVALKTAEAWARTKSGRTAVVVSDRDTFRSTAIVNREPGAGSPPSVAIRHS